MTDHVAPEAAAVDGEHERVAAAAELTRVVAKIAAGLDRPDLGERATLAADRVTRPAVVACVVGEFKQGKSALVNALIGRSVCPVDDDLATSTVTLVHHATEPQVVVRHREGGKQVARPIAPGDLRSYVTEQGNPDNVRRLERVDIGVPAALLADGLTIVDTPGIGGLGAGSSAATLGFLPFADALVFVSDASSELSRPELEFLTRAAGVCPTVLFCLTKIDIYPEWRRIAELDAAHLRALGLDTPILPMSSMVRMLGLQRADDDLEAESGVPDVVTAMRDDVFAPAKRVAAARALAEGSAVTGQLLQGLATELASLEEAAGSAAALASVEEAKTRLEQLRSANSRWSTVLTDRMTDLNNTLSHTFRDRLRRINRELDEAVEAMPGMEAWEPMARQLQADAAAVVSDVFARLEADAATLAQDIATLVQEEAGGVFGDAGEPGGREMDGLWFTRDLRGEQGSLAARKFNDTLTVLRGAQGGIMMLGMAGGLLPAATAGLLLSLPVTLGLGALFAGHAVMEHRKRKQAAMRQQARALARQFLDEVQFQVGDELLEQTRSVQRALRDHFGQRITELLRTHSETAQRLQENARRTEAQRSERITAVRDLVEPLQRLARQLETAKAEL